MCNNDIIKENDWDIDVNTAINNYQEYQNSLKYKFKNIIEKWCREISQASTRGKKYIHTNQFITDDEDKILWLIDDVGCMCEFAPDIFLNDFIEIFKNKGFKVTKITFPQNDSCCLCIEWIF